MLFIERDDMVEQLSAHAADPSLGDTVLPRAAICCPARFNAKRLQSGDYPHRENRVAIEDQMPRHDVEPDEPILARDRVWSPHST
jgi:hypothetical protein